MNNIELVHPPTSFQKPGYKDPDWSKYAFPMRAIGFVQMPEAEYAPGNVFDAGDQGNANFLLKVGAASTLPKEPVPEVSAEASTVVKTKDDSVERFVPIDPKVEPAKELPVNGTLNDKRKLPG